MRLAGDDAQRNRAGAAFQIMSSRLIACLESRSR